MICCFTGHRVIPPEHMLRLPQELDVQLNKLIVCGVDTFRTGGALGFDTLAALKVLEKKDLYSYIKLELILPCRDQASTWSPRNREIYNYIASEADSIEYVSDVYTATCMHERNRRLVDGSDFCLSYCTSQKGGSAYTLAYAKKRGVDIIKLLDN